LGLLLLCLLGLIAIGAGAHAHAVHQAVRGARWLWLGTAVLALVLTLIASVADVDLGPGSLVPLFVDPLLPALALAALASGIAVTC
jgi:formate-dependent nitrite reductase membrane component NrfD